MGRNYNLKWIKRKYDNDEKLRILHSYDKVCGKEAVKCARLHDVPQSTISTWVKQRAIGTLLSAGGTGSKTAIPPLIENDLVDVIVLISDCGQHMDRTAVQDLVKSLCEFMKWEVTKFKDNRPGLDWCRAFENRHKDRLAKHKRMGLSYAQSSGLTEDNVKAFYELWQALVTENNVRPENIWNCDKSGFQPNHKGGQHE